MLATRTFAHLSDELLVRWVVYRVHFPGDGIPPLSRDPRLVFQKLSAGNGGNTSTQEVKSHFTITAHVMIGSIMRLSLLRETPPPWGEVGDLTFIKANRPWLGDNNRSNVVSPPPPLGHWEGFDLYKSKPREIITNVFAHAV